MLKNSLPNKDGLRSRCKQNSSKHFVCSAIVIIILKWVIVVDLVVGHRKIRHQIPAEIQKAIQWTQCHRLAHWPISVSANFKRLAIYRHHHSQRNQRPERRQLFLAVDYQNMDTQRWIQSHSLLAHRNMRWANANPKQRTSKLPPKHNILFHAQSEITFFNFTKIRYPTTTKQRYFDDDDEQTPNLAYIPAPGSPSAEQPAEVFILIAVHSFDKWQFEMFFCIILGWVWFRWRGSTRCIYDGHWEAFGKRKNETNYWIHCNGSAKK